MKTRGISVPTLPLLVALVKKIAFYYENRRETCTNTGRYFDLDHKTRGQQLLLC